MIFINLLAAGISLEEIDPLIKCGLCKRIRGYVYSLEVHPKTKDVIDKNNKGLEASLRPNFYGFFDNYFGIPY